MKFLFLINFLISTTLLFGGGCWAQTCNNPYEARIVRATGDWSTLPLWNAVEPNGLMKFVSAECSYAVTIGGLRPSTKYQWKVTLDNVWVTSFGCGSGGNCEFTTNSNGVIRLIFKPNVNQLLSDNNYNSIDFTIPCVDKFSGKAVRAVGEWNTWVVDDPRNLMSLDTEMCSYVLNVGGLQASKSYQWKVAIGLSWAESYGCGGNGQANCDSTTNARGEVRYIFRPDNNQPSSDQNITDIMTTSPTTPTSTTTTPLGQTTESTSTQSTTKEPTVNPIIPCTGQCAPCTNNFASKLVRVTGDWTIDAGSNILWAGNESLGLMTFEEKFCLYTRKITNLKPNTNYQWKATINNAFAENYGCSGINGPNCAFKSSSTGGIRFLFKPSTNPPQLTTDLNVFDCGDEICSDGETCSYCPEDCGECPPSVCGDGICEPDENFMTCPEDCVNELPGCERFNDEGCRSGSQIDANDGSAKRKWQTPKPGTKDYKPSYQDMYALWGYADIRYTSPARTQADVCIITKHKDEGKVTLQFYFNDQPQASNCKQFDSSYKSQVALKVTASDGTQLIIDSVDLIWNTKPIASRPGDYRNGQKGAVVEFFGWPHKDVEKECEILAKAGYLGAKLFPVHEQLMSTQPFNDALNPWYFMYQPVSYRFNGRMGTREELQSLINTCRSLGVRVYVDMVLNHMVGAGNDLLEHRNPNGCVKWGNKTSSAPEDRASPFYTHAYTYQYNPNTGEPPSQEFPNAFLGPDDFHCDRILGSWSDLFILNNGWLVGLTDIHTGKDNVRERQAAYLVELLSMGVSGFRVDAAKHMSPQDISAVFKKVQTKMGGQLPDDFFAWLEVLTGGESGVIWTGPSWYGTMFEGILRSDLGSQSEVDKIKMWDGLYPKEPGNNPLISRKRVVIQNDDHDQQEPGSSSRDMGPFGCVLVKNCGPNDHRGFETKLFDSPYQVGNNAEDWPIRFILSSYYHTHGTLGVPDGFSDCAKCTVTCATCKESVPYEPAYVAGACGYDGKSYTRCHRDVRIINAMRRWINLGSISGSDIGLPGCN